MPNSYGTYSNGLPFKFNCPLLHVSHKSDFTGSENLNDPLAVNDAFPDPAKRVDLTPSILSIK
jgi:hypothetical protein